ncbi:MAG TPA: tripartite tricarboxylate transporter substrate binding protein [Beijerinckiaceae bacterium]|jgi:tripartite-type tricarboxylate transporter receptor subunit TctC|nr:tripartite tricarboxylate transporter substrate binding protein [Beijerinckiaceae bacterium]
MSRILTALLMLGGISVSVDLATPGRAQTDFPSRPIKMIVPFPPGGGIDVTARIVAQGLTEVLGQQIVVQNLGGAGGAIATDTVAKANPDGYTLLYHSTTGIVNAAVTERLPYDWMHDLAPVSIVTRFAPVMIVSPTLPVKDLKEFIALLKASPGKYSFASSGAGSAVHLAEELFIQKADVQMVHIPYRGTATSMPDILAGRVAMMIDGVPVQTENIHNGSVRALAVTTKTRSPSIPDIPTMKEAGLDYEVPFWTAIYVPSQTPKPTIEKLASAIGSVMHDATVIKQLANVGTEAVGSSPDELSALDRQQFDLYRELVRDNKSLMREYP